MNTDSKADLGAMSISEAARTADCSRTILYQEIKANRLVASKLGRRTIILRTDFGQWLRTLPAWPATDKVAT